MRRGRIFAAVGLAVALAAGCSPAGATTQPRVAHTKTVTDHDKGTTVTLHVGDRLKVVLASTYWTIHPSSNAAVLRSDGRPIVTGQLNGCVPGEGCGTATRLFTAIATGKASVSASRTSCGEALRCTAGHGTYKVSVLVK